MAIKNSASTSNGKDLPKADGWLNNISFTDKAGKSVRVGKTGIPLYLEQNLHKQLIAKKNSLPEGERFYITLTAEVYVPAAAVPEEEEYKFDL
jgi:hypothetical protein